MKITELNKELKHGYKVEDLTPDERLLIQGMLLVLDDIRIDPLEYQENIIGTMKKEIAEETVDEIRNNIILTIADHVVSMLDEHEI